MSVRPVACDGLFERCCSRWVWKEKVLQSPELQVCTPNVCELTKYVSSYKHMKTLMGKHKQGTAEQTKHHVNRHWPSREKRDGDTEEDLCVPHQARTAWMARGTTFVPAWGGGKRDECQGGRSSPSRVIREASWVLQHGGGMWEGKQTVPVETSTEAPQAAGVYPTHNWWTNDWYKSQINSQQPTCWIV